MSLVKTWPIEDLPIGLLDEQDSNPNEMSDDQFSALVEEILESGWLVPIQVRGPYPDGRYKLIGGHHRTKAAKVIGLEEVSAVVIDPDEFDEDWDEIQLVKQNVLHGELNPVKFTELFNKLTQKYDARMVQSMMAFTKEDAFQRVYLDAKKALPPDMQAKLDEVRDELKTVDDLSLVLNRLFTEYGSTVPFHFMFLSFGGKEHLMVQLKQPGSWQRWKQFAQWCHDEQVPMDEALMARLSWPT